MKLNHAVIAGTFDHLHLGHQTLINQALETAQTVSCGLSPSSLTQKKPLSKLIQSQSNRQLKLQQFLKSRTNYFNLFTLKNSLEPATYSPTLDSIIASKETEPTVTKINLIRVKNRLQPLKPIIIDLIQASDHQKLSSTRIRKGEINRLGYAYKSIFPQHQKLSLPSLHRSDFKKPFDTLLTGSLENLSWATLKAKKILKKNPPFLTITVGDIATLSLLNQHLPINLAIVDLKTRRQTLFSSLKSLGLKKHSSTLTTNPSSTITADLVNTITNSLNLCLKKTKSPRSILVKGEEDLAVIPAILLSPLNTAIFYGQPYQGLVYIKVTENKKQKALALLQKLI